MATTGGADPTGVDGSEVDDVVGSLVEALHLPGAAVVVVDARGGTVVSCHGRADPATGRPWTPDTPSRIGSISKTLTTLALLRHVDAGRLDLDAPVAPLLPERLRGPRRAAPITARHLLTHTSGIGEVASWRALRHPMWAVGGADPRRPLPSLATLLAPGVVAEVAPGARWVYSNPAYSVLGRLVEVLDGRPLPDVLDDAVLAPAGMAASTARSDRIDRTRLAVGQLGAGDGFRPARAYEVATVSAGGVVATAADLGTYARHLLAAGIGHPTPLGSREALGQALAVQHEVHPRLRSVGLTLWRRRLGRRTAVGHGGSLPGHSAGLQVCPEAGLGVVALTNRAVAPSAEFGGGRLATEVLAHLLGATPDPTVDEPADGPDLTGVWCPPPGRLTAVRGLVALGGELHLGRDADGRWRARSPVGLVAGAGVPLERLAGPGAGEEPPGDPAWRLRAGGVALTLVAELDARGEASRLLLDGIPCPFTLTRRSGWTTPRARLAGAGLGVVGLGATAAVGAARRRR